MSISILPDMIDGYFNQMQSWDDAAKQETIVRLLYSLNPQMPPSENANDFSACCGAWQDDRNAEEIVREIYENRRNCLNSEDF